MKFRDSIQQLIMISSFCEKGPEGVLPDQDTLVYGGLPRCDVVTHFSGNIIVRPLKSVEKRLDIV